MPKIEVYFYNFRNNSCDDDNSGHDDLRYNNRGKRNTLFIVLLFLLITQILRKFLIFAIKPILVKIIKLHTNCFREKVMQLIHMEPLIHMLRHHQLYFHQKWLL